MMFKMEVTTDNASFHEDGVPEEDALRNGMADILRKARVKMTNAAYPSQYTGDQPMVLFDINGARVGVAWFEEE